MFRKFTVSLSLLLMVIALSACAGAAASPAPAAQPDDSAPKPVEVQVKLSEFKIEPSIATFKTGVPYHFVVTNEGTVAHELMIMAPMDMNAAATMDMEELDEMALGVIEEEDLQPGATVTLDFTFSELAPMGTLEFSCHTPGHYAGGMKTPITVQ
jgi:uncharacterized cupredoxin-like copper-binding protein